jgi:hypothetical protein
VHELIASPFVDDYLVLHPGSTQGLKIPDRRYPELRQVAATSSPAARSRAALAGASPHDAPAAGRATGAV